MPRRSFAEAQAALESASFTSDRDRRECNQLLEARKAQAIREVRSAAQQTVADLRAKVEDLEGRYESRDAEAVALLKEIRRAA